MTDTKCICGHYRLSHKIGICRFCNCAEYEQANETDRPDAYDKAGNTKSRVYRRV